MTATSYDALSVEKYQYQGKSRKRFHKIGRMVPGKDGKSFNLYIPEGIAVSGHVMIAPANAQEEELSAQYDSAADQYGV